MSMRVDYACNYEEKRNTIAYDYITFFESLGFMISLIPNNTTNIEIYLQEKYDMVVLTGGNNVDPLLYGKKKNMENVYSERDALEYKIIEYAFQRNIPILGICKGAQILNVYFGGKIISSISGHVNKEHILESSIGYLDKQKSNSYHDQGIDLESLGSPLIPIATHKGIIEAFIHKNKKVMGVQWHPERQNRDFDHDLVLEFIEGNL